MNRTCILICVLLLGLSTPAGAHGIEHIELTCPICNTRAITAVEIPCPASHGPAKGIREGLSESMEWSIHECPHCHYSGRLHAFAHEDLEYSPCAPHKLDLPSKEQIEAIRKMLADRKDLYSGRFLYRTERFALAEKCLQLRKANAETMLHISLMCAWMHDDNGEDALASEYRKKALKACRTTLKHGISNQTQRIRRRTLQWVIIGKIGESEEAMRGLSTLLAEAKRTVSIRSKSMPPKPEYFDENYRDGFREIPEDLFDDYKDDNRSEHAPPPLDSRTKAKRRNMWTAWLALREFQEAVSAIEYRMIWIRCRTSDLTGALAIARKTGFDGRYAFLAMHRSTNDPKVIDAIKALFATPLHKPLRPDENEDRESRERKKEDRSRLFDVLYDDGRISYTSNTLYKYVCNTVEREDLDYVSISSPDKHEPDNRYKDIPTADIVRELPQEWINVQKEKPRRYYKFPRHELAELARRSDKHAITALTADFKLHLASCARWAGVLVDDWFPELPPNYDFEYPYPWEHPYRTLEDYWPVYKTLARDAAMPSTMTNNLIDDIRSGRISNRESVVGLMPLGFLKTKESRRMLIEAAQLKNSTAAFTAAKCLLLHNDRAGKDAMINVILKNRQWDLPSDKTGQTFIRMLEAKDAAILPKFKKSYYKNIKGSRPPMAFKSDFSDKRPEGRGWPIRLVGALAKLDPKQIGIYDAFIDELGEPEQRPADGDWSKTTGGYCVRALIKASDIHYRPNVGKKLLAALDSLGNEELSPKIIGALARSPAPGRRQAIAKQLLRPIPLTVKAAIIKASEELDIPGLPEKLVEWSKSSNPRLAEPAKAALARTNKAQK